MFARAVASRQGWYWVVDGFRLFRKSPFMWVALTLVLALLWLLSFAVPLLGALIFNLLSPVFFAGLMLGCRALEQGEDLELAHLFAGFRTHSASLVTIGGVHLVGSIIIVGLFYAIAGGMNVAAMVGATRLPPEVLLNMMLGLLVALALYTPLLMVIWFAPLLVVFDGVAPVPAMKDSFVACCKNLMPFLLYALVLLAAWVIAVIPAFLGLLVFFPLIFCSIYASYRDVFQHEHATVSHPVAG